MLREILYLIIAILLIITILLYLFICIRRLISFLLSKKSKRFKTNISIIVLLLCLLPIVFLSDAAITWTIFLIHMCVMTLLTQLVNIILTKLLKNIPKANLCENRVFRIWNTLNKLMIIPIIFSIAICIYGYSCIKDIVETDYVIYTDKEIVKGEYRIAVLSDVHYGTIANYKSMTEMAERISEQEPDIILLCGDIVDESTSIDDMNEIFNILGSMKNKYGIYFTYGNHDNSQYSVSPNYSHVQLENAIKENDIRILKDEGVVINNDLVLIGRNDKAYERLTVSDIMKEVDKSKLIVMMDHQPYDFIKKSELGVDVQISGHTHAGQIFPVGIIIDLFKIGDMNYGIRDIGGMKAIVSSGVSGWGFPIRTQEKSEYVIVDVKSK